VRFYNDTGPCEDIIIRQNKILNTSGFGIHFNPQLGAAMVKNIIIEKNYIESKRIGIALSGPLGRGYQFDIKIRKNIFKKLGTAIDDAAIVAAHVDGLIVEDNLIDGNLQSILNWKDYPSFNVKSQRNYRLPAPTGLEDIIVK
jgi:hypothetical protein